MHETERLAELVERVVEGDPWHGPSVMGLLDGLSAQAAARHVVPGVHSIWELVIHMTAWCDEVRARLDGAPAGEPSVGDWSAPAAETPAAWTAAVNALVGSHRALAAAVRRLGDQGLETAVVDYRDRAAGTGLSRYLTVHGLVHHTTYHAGQIAVIRRALDTGAWS
jgi:uncharacterized damage-inducible protein DinB